MTTRAGSRLSASPMLMVIAAEGVRLAREHLNNLREAPTPTASMTPRRPASSASHDLLREPAADGRRVRRPDPNPVHRRPARRGVIEAVGVGASRRLLR